MFKEFREFAMRGSVIDIAVGIIIGAAFGTIVSSMVSDIIMPPIGLLIGNVDFSNLFIVLQEGAKAAGPYVSIREAQAAGAVTINFGIFLNHCISFLIIAFSVFMLMRSVNRFKNEEPAPAADPATKECPSCLMAVPIKATKCGHCTSDIRSAQA